MTNDEIRALLEQLKDHHHALLTLGNFGGRALALDRVIDAIETLLAREAEVLEYALNNNMMLGSSSLLADLTAILYPQPAALAEEKTNG